MRCLERTRYVHVLEVVCVCDEERCYPPHSHETQRICQDSQKEGEREKTTKSPGNPKFQFPGFMTAQKVSCDPSPPAPRLPMAPTPTPHSTSSHQGALYQQCKSPSQNTAPLLPTRSFSTDQTIHPQLLQQDHPQPRANATPLNSPPAF